ncbi:hypothetical protein BsWGS_21038 [Bradybaena similaris]
MHFTGAEQETKPVRPAPRSGSCKVQVIPRGKYPSGKQIPRKPWDSTPFRGDTSFTRKTVCKDIVLPVPAPDFKCIPVKQVKCLSNGERQERVVLQCHRTWKAAPWACGPQNYVRVRQFHKWGAGVSETAVAPLPNNYRILYCLGSDKTMNEDVYDHPVVCEIISADQEDMGIFHEAPCPAAAEISSASCCKGVHRQQESDCDAAAECSRHG